MTTQTIATPQNATPPAAPQGATPAGWLYSPAFDSFFIFGTMALAVVGGLSSLYYPALFPIILGANLWLLGYHHVIATFTRLCFDRKSHARAKLLIYALLPAVLGIVLLLAHFGGLWVIACTYLYGQWFHYSRQSWGISRAYERNAPAGYKADRSWATQLAFYAFPVWGILYRSWQAPTTFLGLPIKPLPVSGDVMVAAGIIAVFFFAVWLVRVFNDWRRDVMPPAYVCFMLSHFSIFYIAYLKMPSLDTGWLVANIWHNLQYLLFVWMFNNRRYKTGVDPEAKLISQLSQKQNAALYFIVTLAITSVIYLSIKTFFAGMTVLVLAYMTINFHHYIVDAIIWRASWVRRDKPPAAAQPPAAQPAVSPG